MNKQKLAVLIWLVLCISISHAQLRPTINNYGIYSYRFFDSLIKLHPPAFTMLDDDYSFIVFFDITECGQVLNYQAIPRFKPIPTEVTEYVKEFFKATNGRWTSPKDNVPLLPLTKTCYHIQIHKKKTVGELFKRLAKQIDFEDELECLESFSEEYSKAFIYSEWLTIMY